MEYIIFYDENYLDETKKEIGNFAVLADGIGLISETNFSNKNYIMDNYISFEDSLYNRLKYSIFVRHFYKVEKIANSIQEVNIDDLNVTKSNVCALHIVYGKKVENETQNVLVKLKDKGIVCDIKKPDVIISMTVVDKVYVGVTPREELSTNYRRGMPHYAMKGEISRAEFKLQEAIEYYNLDLSNVHNVLDLGASPGGWTHLLAEKGIKVAAVDPADLDARVYKNKNVKHYKELSQKFLTHYDGKFDLVVNDMKMFGDKSAHIVCNCAKNFESGTILVMTIKLAETKIWEQIIAALDILKENFQIIGVKKLFHNRQEVTVVAKFR